MLASQPAANLNKIQLFPPTCKPTCWFDISSSSRVSSLVTHTFSRFCYSFVACFVSYGVSFFSPWLALECALKILPSVLMLFFNVSAQNNCFTLNLSKRFCTLAPVCAQGVFIKILPTVTTHGPYGRLLMGLRPSESESVCCK